MSGLTRLLSPTPDVPTRLIEQGFLNPKLVTFTRASSGTFFDANGVLQSALTNVPRFNHLQDGSGESGYMHEGEARINNLRNSTMVGAVAGTPGTRPTNWVNFGASGLTQEIVGVGTINGMDYIDWKISGTSAGTGYDIGFEGSTQIVAATGEDWTESLYCAVVGGDFTNITSLTGRVVERTDVGGFVLDNRGPDFKDSLTADLQRIIYEVTLSGGATTARIHPEIIFTFGSGVAIDVTIRIAAPQVEEGPFASSFIPTSTVAVTRSADVFTVENLNTIPEFNPLEDTIYCEFISSGAETATERHIWNINDGTTTANTALFKTGGGDNSQFIVEGEVSNATPFVIDTKYKTALALKNADNNAYIDGIERGSAGFKSKALAAAQTTLTIGNRSAGDRPFFGIIPTLRLEPIRRVDARLKDMTA